jgi:hypothetical protein
MKTMYGSIQFKTRDNTSGNPNFKSIAAEAFVRARGPRVQPGMASSTETRYQALKTLVVPEAKVAFEQHDATLLEILSNFAAWQLRVQWSH